MPRFFFHLRDGQSIDDPDGMFLPNAAMARLEAIRSARDIMAEDVRRGVLDLSVRIEITDAHGEPILAVPFREVVKIEH
ncbi:MAG TPA: hypothetical protein VN231_10430 [Allosphingosinicella sp.]|nr:hypothetical protein [Allosphingosinicella sp.]